MNLTIFHTLPSTMKIPTIKGNKHNIINVNFQLMTKDTIIAAANEHTPDISIKSSIPIPLSILSIFL